MNFTSSQATWKPSRVWRFARAHDPIGPQHTALLEAMASQTSLAVGLKPLGISAKNAAVLEERNRIGQEIHDGLAQAFTGILMQLGATEEMKVSAGLELVLRRIRDLAREGLQEARRSVLALKPSDPRPGGLELALRQLVERSTVSERLVCRFNGDGTNTGLPPEHEHELLRIAQEAVTNAVRHAHPTAIDIALCVAPRCRVAHDRRRRLRDARAARALRARARAFVVALTAQVELDVRPP